MNLTQRPKRRFGHTQENDCLGPWAKAFVFYERFSMSLKASCPRCRAHLDVAVAVVLADPSVTGRVTTGKGSTPTSVVVATKSTTDGGAVTVVAKDTVTSDSVPVGTANGANADPEDAHDETP